ncbi:hypothetical protein VNO77_29816 [Canavalia gladiata]|uniref:Disease resistance protein At4g27190-like leucine-rich repeats domain-containing protein n=1 Tax=Canavalia gladiata TaxID=3824 RepID=A0AAN9Q138_CANGL
MSVARSLQQLEELSIADCKELRHIMSYEEEDGIDIREDISPDFNTSYLVFPNLKKLSIHYCPKLEFALPSSCVGLVHLQELEIFKASELKYIFGHYNHEHHSSYQNLIQTKLPVLKVLKLQNLANLLGICTGNYQTCCPSLRELSCVNCPKLSTSCIPMMVGLEVGQHLNRGVSYEKEQEKHLTSKLEQVEIRGFSELRFIWSYPTSKQNVSLQYLQYLKVDGCAKLKCVFSIMMVHRSLPELTSLVIYQCEALEEIIAGNEQFQSLANAKICFPKLRHLAVKNCNKLRSLFSIDVVGMLPQLSTLHISEATELKEVFIHDGEEGIANDEKIEFPSLREIKFTKLSSLVNFCQGFKLQPLKAVNIMIDECPKFPPISGAT